MFAKHNYKKQHNPDENLGGFIKRAGSQLTATIERALTAFDMSHAQFGIFLKLLHHGRPHTVSGLAQDLKADTKSVINVLEGLEQKGFVKRSRGHDNVSVKVEPTAKGRQLAEHMQVGVQTLSSHLQGLLVPPTQAESRPMARCPRYRLA